MWRTHPKCSRFRSKTINFNFAVFLKILLQSRLIDDSAPELPPPKGGSRPQTKPENYRFNLNLEKRIKAGRLGVIITRPEGLGFEYLHWIVDCNYSCPIILGRHHQVQEVLSWGNGTGRVLLTWILLLMLLRDSGSCKGPHDPNT